MHLKHGFIALFFCLIMGLFCHAQSEEAGIPQLVKNGKATQLVVDGKPFLIIGGELNNSTSSSVAYMRPPFEW